MSEGCGWVGRGVSRGELRRSAGGGGLGAGGACL